MDVRCETWRQTDGSQEGILENLDSELKSRNITWSTKVRLVKAMVFPVQRVDSLEKTLMLGGIGDRRRRG